MTGSQPRLFRLALLGAAALMLQGCLAAAIPVIAGSAMATRDVLNESGDEQAAVEEPSGNITVGTGAVSVEAATGENSIQSNGDGWVTSQLTELPAPGARSAPGSSDAAYLAFANYALQQASPLEEGPVSAVLANPGSLDGVRSDCQGQPQAVLIDLDPQGGLVTLESVGEADPGLVSALATLRRQGTVVGWISGRLGIDAARIQDQLITSGLDPLGEDTLLLMEDFGQTKQQRRRQFGSDYCLVAIAGDQSSDFDELFDYLKDHSAAFRLEALRGAGWFITPVPIAPVPTNKE